MSSMKPETKPHSNMVSTEEQQGKKDAPLLAPESKLRAQRPSYTFNVQIYLDNPFQHHVHCGRLSLFRTHNGPYHAHYTWMTTTSPESGTLGRGSMGHAHPIHHTTRKESGEQDVIRIEDITCCLTNKLTSTSPHTRTPVNHSSVKVMLTFPLLRYLYSHAIRE